MEARRALLPGVLALIITLGLVQAVLNVRVVTTRGVSMQPAFYEGDVALVHAGRPHVGSVVAYPSGSLGGLPVLHRVIAVEGDGRLVTKGDNNSWIDPDRPLPSELLGTLVLRVPGGGVWWHRLTSPTLLGVVAFALIALTGTSTAARRSRRGRRQTGRPLPRPLSLL